MQVGIDIVKIKRVEKMLEDPGAIKRIFNADEITDNTESLAGKLAAKEAFFKALGKKENWLDIIIKKNTAGRPFFVICGKKAANILLSISHEEEYAVAVVIIK